MDGQSVEPGIEPVRVAQPGKVPPGEHHRLLDRVSRELRVPEDESGGRVQSREGPVDERAEGVMIALTRPLHETSLVHGRLPLGATLWSHSPSLTSVGRRIVPASEPFGLEAAHTQ